MLIEDLLRNVCHPSNGEFEDTPAVLVDVVHSLSDGFFRCGIQASARRHIQIPPACPVAAKNEVDDSPLTLLCRFDENSPGAIAEQNACRAILKINDGCHHIGANDKHFIVSASCDKLRCSCQRVNETRTCAGQVKTPRFTSADLRLNQTCAGRKKHVGRDGGDNDQVQFCGV